MRDMIKLVVVGLAIVAVANTATADKTRPWKEREEAKKAQQQAERERLLQEDAAEAERLLQEAAAERKRLLQGEAAETLGAPPPVVPVFQGEATKVHIEYTAPKYNKQCNVYWRKGGPIAGTTVSPLIMGGGAGLAGASNGDKVLLGVGIAMAVGGLVGTIVSGHFLKQRSQRRYQQRVLGCPTYK